MKDRYVVVLTTAPRIDPATIALASKLARQAHATLFFLHVVTMRPSDGAGLLVQAVRLVNDDEARWHDTLFPDDPTVRFRRRLEVGVPEERVARLVNTHDVEYVVVEEPPGLWFMRERLTDRLVRKLRCPVVVVGPELRGSSPPAVDGSLPAMPGRTEELLDAIVDARAHAVGLWMDQVAQGAAQVSRSSAVRDGVRAGSRHGGLMDVVLVARLQQFMEEHRRAAQAIGWELSTPKRRWSSAEHELQPSAALDQFWTRLEVDGHSTSLPVALDPTGSRLGILAGARVQVGDAEGRLILVFDAHHHFLRILGQPGPVPSFETYAFDSTGLMLSNSRFPHHLRQAGLLPNEERQTPLRLRVAEPSERPRAEWPLTRMARDATRHRNGADTTPYLDYRGTPVVGAWRWISRYAFGVTAEVDHQPRISSRSS